MNFSSIPYKFSIPWGATATAGYITTLIPVNAVGGAAGQSVGFPPITAANIAAGGIPPNIADFNGLGNYVTSWVQWQQAGGPIPYDATFAANISGYPNGAVLSSTVNGRYWLNAVDNNISNPDTGGTGWIPLHHQPTRWYVYNTSQTITVLGPNVDFIVVAGGGTGGVTGGASNQYPGGGGGGGEALVGSITGLTANVSTITLTVGSGGGGGGATGSASSIVCSGVSLSASPGVGGGVGTSSGASGGAGGYTTSPTNITVFSSSNYAGYRSPGAPGEGHWVALNVYSGRGGANGLGQAGAPFGVSAGISTLAFPGIGGGGGTAASSVGYGANGIALLKM